MTSTPARRLRAVPAAGGTAERAQQRELFALVLRSGPSRRGKPFSDRTIGAYLDAVVSLDRYLTSIDHPSGFDSMTVHHLNAYLTDYLARHTLGGTVTKQGNLRVFLHHLVTEYQAPDLWADPRRHRYQRQEERPPVLEPILIAALLRATAGRSFEDRRDHAIIRLLLTGARRQEVTELRVEDMDLTSALRSAQVVGLKGRPGRRIPLGDKDALTVRRWLTVRAKHPKVPDADRGPLWIAEKSGAVLTGNGIYQMLRRRVVQAGYPREAVRPHLFRHTFAHEFLAAGGSESDLLALAGWKDRSMLDRYGASMAEQRALLAVQRSGFGDRY